MTESIPQTMTRIENRMNKLETDVAYLQGMVSELPTWRRVVLVILAWNIVQILGVIAVLS